MWERGDVERHRDIKRENENMVGKERDEEKCPERG